MEENTSKNLAKQKVQKADNKEERLKEMKGRNYEKSEIRRESIKTQTKETTKALKKREVREMNERNLFISGFKYPKNVVQLYNALYQVS